MSNILLYIIVIAFVVFLTWYPLHLKNIIKNKASELLLSHSLNSLEYIVKVNKFTYILNLIGGYFSVGIFIIPGVIFFKNPNSLFVGIAFAILSVIIGLIFLFRIFYLLPRTYIKYKDNFFTYYNGYKTVFDTKLDNIKEVQNYTYSDSINWYLVIITKYFKEHRLSILSFENPHLIYATLKEKIHNPNS